MYSHLYQSTSVMNKTDLKEFISDFKTRITFAERLIADEDQLLAAKVEEAISEFVLERYGKAIRTNVDLIAIDMKIVIDVLEARISMAYGSQSERLNDLSRTARRLIKEIQKRLVARRSVELALLNVSTAVMH